MRSLIITESGGLFHSKNLNGGDVQSRSLAGLLEKIDPGNEPVRYEYAAAILDKALGTAKADTGIIRQGVQGL